MAAGNDDNYYNGIIQSHPEYRFLGEKDQVYVWLGEGAGSWSCQNEKLHIYDHHYVLVDKLSSTINSQLGSYVS